MEAVTAQSEASQRLVMETMKARVVTRAFGIRLGPIALDYTFKQMEVDPGATGQAQDQTRQEAAAQAQQTVSTHPDPTWRRGLTAYAQASAQLGPQASQALGVA
jgi:hypothetical protein